MQKTNEDIDLDAYKIWILDFDGTLYYQFPVRIAMGIWLAIYYFLHPWRIKEVFIIFEYRKLREELSGALIIKEYMSDSLINKLCDSYHIESDNISNIVKSWLETKPCFFIHKWQRKKLIRAIQEYQKKGVLMIVYSDNPLKEKIKAISFIPDDYFDSEHELIKCMKPNTRGLKNIVELLGIKKENFIYIGDRNDRDGICAHNSGIAYCDVNDFEELLNLDMG